MTEFEHSSMIWMIMKQFWMLPMITLLISQQACRFGDHSFDQVQILHPRPYPPIPEISSSVGETFKYGYWQTRYGIIKFLLRLFVFGFRFNSVFSFHRLTVTTSCLCKSDWVILFLTQKFSNIIALNKFINYIIRFQNKCTNTIDSGTLLKQSKSY